MSTVGGHVWKSVLLTTHQHVDGKLGAREETGLSLTGPAGVCHFRKRLAMYATCRRETYD